MESSLQAHKAKKHGVNSAEEMNTPQEDLEATQEAEDLDLTLEAESEDSAAPSTPVVEFTIFPEVTGEVSPDSIVTDVAVDVINNNNNGIDDYVISSDSAELPAAEEDES